MRIKDKKVFELQDRGYKLEGFYLKDTETSKGDAYIIITKDDKFFDAIVYAYKIYNYTAHFKDIVDGFENGNDSGLRIASSTGLEFLAQEDKPTAPTGDKGGKTLCLKD